MANSKIKFRYGICQNSHMEETGKPCPLCQSKQIQKVIATKDLVCSECKEKLKEIPRPKTFWEKYGKLVITAVVVLLLGGGVACYTLIGGSKGPTKINLSQKELVMKVGETQVIVPTADPEGVKVTFVFKTQSKNINVNSGGEVTALKKGEATVRVKCEENPNIGNTCKIKIEEAEIAEPEPQAEEAEAAEPEEVSKEESKDKSKEGKPKPNPGPTGEQNGYGTKQLSYGTYVGKLKNGQPDGSGKLTFTKSHQLNSEYTAQPGEYIQGIFENGKPSFVTYYQKDGTVTKIKLR